MEFSISLNGLRVAQQAIDLIGTNIANVSTDGYHRQDALIEPVVTGYVSGQPIGGAQIKSYRRSVDTLLEDQLLHQRPLEAQIEQELSALQSLQAAFGDLDAGGLTSAMNDFFGALEELSANPASPALREQAVWAADSLAANFRHLGSTIEDLSEQVVSEAQILVDEVNAVAQEVAELNGRIRAITLRGGNANLLADQRDRAVYELAKLVQIDASTRTDGSGMVDVRVEGTPLVFLDQAVCLEVTTVEDGQLALRVEDSLSCDTEIREGKLGGLFSLRNDLLADIQGDLDDLAAELQREINQVHLQGVGLAGAFEQLTGGIVSDPDVPLGEWLPPVTSGTMHLRLTDPAGEVTNYSVAIDAATDTLNTVAGKIDALAPGALSASVIAGTLRIEGQAGHRFDFLPTPDLQTPGPWTGTATATASGMYDGSANDVFTFTVQGTGQIGVDEGLGVEVRNAAGELLTTLSIGQGYAARDTLTVHDGISVAFDVGTVTDGEQFTVDVMVESDPTGLLLGAGIGSLFEGVSASELAVRQEILDDTDLLATALGAEMTDSTAVQRMADVAEKPLEALGNVSVTDAFRLLVTGLGQKISIRSARLGAIQDVTQQLENQKEQISGVDMNEQAAKLLVFETMFQGVAKYLATQRVTMDTLIDLL